MSTMSFSSPCMFASAPRKQLSSVLIKNPSLLGSIKSLSKTVGLKSSSGFRASMAVYKIKLIGPNGEDNVFDATNDAYILDSAKSWGGAPVFLPCWSMLHLRGQNGVGFSGPVRRFFLDDNQMKEGYVLTCISYPTSDGVIHTHKETDLY